MKPVRVRVRALMGTVMMFVVFMFALDRNRPGIRRGRKIKGNKNQ
jgi:hypothetical protein